MKENKIVIYGVKSKDKYHYIGKTECNVKDNGNINNSDVHRQYVRKDIRDVFLNNINDTNVVAINIVDKKDWYNKKLNEVVIKHNENNPLLNTQWMLEGKRGYWEDKKRDEHTLQRLSESKYKKIIQYDINGNLIKTWNSIKDVAINIFKDYKIVNGGSKTKLYTVLKSDSLNSRFKLNSYWFKEEELLEVFNSVPIKLNIESIKKEEKKTKVINKNNAQQKLYNITGQKIYTVIHYNDDNTIKQTYQNTYEAAYVLHIKRVIVQRICRGKIKNTTFKLKYGEKIKQLNYNRFPEYIAEPIIYIKSEKKPRKKYYIKTKTTYKNSINQYNENGDLIDSFKNIKIASTKLNLRQTIIKQICKGCYFTKNNKYFPILKFNLNNSIK